MIKWTLNQVVDNPDGIGSNNASEKRPVDADADIMGDIGDMFESIVATGKCLLVSSHYRKTLTVCDMPEAHTIRQHFNGDCQCYDGIKAIDDRGTKDDWSCYVWQTSNNSYRAALICFGDSDTHKAYWFDGIDDTIPGM